MASFDATALLARMRSGGNSVETVAAAAAPALRQPAPQPAPQPTPAQTKTTPAKLRTPAVAKPPHVLALLERADPALRAYVQRLTESRDAALELLATKQAVAPAASGAGATPQRDSAYMATLEEAVRALEARLDRELELNQQMKRQVAANERKAEAQRQQLQWQVQQLQAAAAASPRARAAAAPPSSSSLPSSSPASSASSVPSSSSLATTTGGRARASSRRSPRQLSHPGNAARAGAKTPRSGPQRAFVPCGSSGSHRFGGTGTGRRTNTPVVVPGSVNLDGAQPAVLSLDFM